MGVKAYRFFFFCFSYETSGRALRSAQVVLRGVRFPRDPDILAEWRYCLVAPRGASYPRYGRSRVVHTVVGDAAWYPRWWAMPRSTHTVVGNPAQYPRWWAIPRTVVPTVVGDPA